MTEACCCGKGSHTNTGKPHYCTKHMRWSDAPAQSRVTHGYVKHGYADIVYSVSNGHDGRSMSTWMVPGTYDAKADAPPPNVIAAMFGYPFDVDKWHIKLGDQFWSASDLRMVAQNMDDCKVIYDDQVSVPTSGATKKFV